MNHGISGMEWPTDWQSFLGAWSEGMERICLYGTLVLFLALLLMRLLRRMQPAVRCWIGRLAFLKLYLLLAGCTAIALPVLPHILGIRAGNLVSQIRLGTSPRNGQNATTPALKSPTGTFSGEGTILPIPRENADLLKFLTPILFGVWGMGVLVGSMRILWQYQEARALMRSARPITDPMILAEFTRVKTALGLRGNPILAVSASTEVPLLFGLLRPTVVLPVAVVSGFAPDACRMILAHELAHVKRHDLFWSCLTSLALIPCFFHPLVWWVRCELRTLQEICCDEYAIRSVAVSTHAYGEVLVRVAVAPISSTQNGLISVAMAESSTNIQRRLEEMQTFRVNSGWKRWTPAMAVVIGGAALMPWQLKAQTQAQRVDPSALFPQKRIDDHTLQLGGYTLMVMGMPPKERPRALFTPLENLELPAEHQEVDANGFFWLDIGGANKENLMLVHGAMNLHGRDDRNQIVFGPANVFGPAKPTVSPTKQNVDRAILLLQTKVGAKSLKSLEGDLVVEDGQVQTFTFAAEGLRPNTSQQAGLVHVTIDSVEHKRGRLDMQLTCKYPFILHQDSKNFLEKEAERIGHHRQPQVEIIGTDGVVYKSSIGSSYDIATPTNTPHADDPSVFTRTMTAQDKYVFDRLPEAFHPASFVVRVVEEHGANLRVPFKFTNIPLPDSL